MGSLISSENRSMRETEMELFLWAGSSLMWTFEGIVIRKVENWKLVRRSLLVMWEQRAD